MMSALSPRGSISGGSDVASDFSDSLKDLQQNNRYEISNLTLIAKESTEHAQNISSALETHIKSIAPSRKLPALYVLDSIVKNVGTPYTVYLGRNLYHTFMDAYTKVDAVTRRSMEGMLRTWKEPVPGSLDHRPVFPLETVRPIENALIKAKTAVLQSQRQVLPQAPYQNTPTPPQTQMRFNPPPQFPQQTYLQQNGGYASQTPFMPTHQEPYQQSTPVQQPADALEVLKADIANLITQGKGQLAMNLYDQNVQTRLQGLLHLQTAIHTTVLSHAELDQIRASVSRLSQSAPLPARSTPQPAVSTPQWQPPVPNAQISHPTAPVIPYAEPSSVPSQLSLPILAPGALDGLQALLSSVQKPSTPQMRTAVPALQYASHTHLNQVQNNVAAAPTSNTADLLAALSKSGILSKPPVVNPAPSYLPPASAPPQPSGQSTAALLASLQGVIKPQTGTPFAVPIPFGGVNKPKIPMTAAALKGFRPELVRSLYDDQPNQCTNCGRRFLLTEEGREKKQRHLDWHFRTNQRMADPNTNRGHHRNWYVDEMEWIRLTEFDPSTTTADASNATAKEPEKGPKDQCVRAPAGVTKNTCSVCYEEMRSSYSEELQDWVFMNATYYNGKIAHATCVEDIKKSQSGPLGGGAGGSLAAALAGLGGTTGQRQRSATPDSLLGKRKAEDVSGGAGVRMRMG